MDASRPNAPDLPDDVLAASVAPESTVQRDSSLADVIGRALAITLSDPEMRARLRDDLRDSPFRERRLHLQSYLAGARGRELVRRAISAMSSSNESLIDLAAKLPPLELVMPRAIDRMRWSGTSDLLVISTSATIAERYKRGISTLPGFDLKGNRVEVPFFTYSSAPYVVIQPAERRFTGNPEATRQSFQGSRSGSTVTTAALERGMMMAGCDPETDPGSCCEFLDECDGEPGGTGTESGGATLPAFATQYFCFGVTSTLNSTTDRDDDDVHDSCEYEIASALQPLLNLGVADEAPFHETYWSLSRDPDIPTNVQIMYAIGYHRDPGDPTLHSHAHERDSEFIILEAKATTGSTWAIVNATLSAHWGTSVDATATYDYHDLEYPYVYRARPRIWAARNKHANYRSKAVCDYGPGGWLGLFGTDTCDGIYYGLDVGVLPDANLGNYFHKDPLDLTTQLRNCTLSRNAAYWGRYGDECFWSDVDYFAGWFSSPELLDEGDLPTPYRDILEVYGF